MQTQTMRRSLLLGALAAAAGASLAQTPYPNRPIRILVGTIGGALTDGVARLYGQKLSELLKVPVVIDNRPGGSNLIAIRALLQAPPDGYTLYVAPGASLSVTPALRNDAPYDPIKDFTPLGFLGTSAGTLFVHAGLPVNTVAELVAYGKANPGKLNYASTDAGGGRVTAEYFMHLTGLRMQHIPLKSDPETVFEVASGRVQVGITTSRPVVPFVAKKELRALATVDWTRTPQLPDVPSVAELGIKGLENLAPYSYFGLMGPANMPPEVVKILADAVISVTNTPEVQRKMRESLVLEPKVLTQQEMRQFIAKEIAKWREAGKSLDIKL